jgi:hypothetical protein
MNGNQSLEQQRAEMAEKALDETLDAAVKKAKEYQELARSQRRKYSIAKALAVVLGVSTPTFVAFQTQHSFPEYNLLFSIIAICVTTGTGIVGGLQAAFKWGEGFGRSTIAALQLDELVGSIKLESLLFRTTPDHGLKYNEMKRLHEKAWRQMRQVIQTQSQSEVADITEPPKRVEEPKTGATAPIGAKGA